MRERPILLNAEMVRAVLDGRKSQTRRIMKVQPHAGVRSSVFVKSGFEDGHGKELACPFGAVSDRLWVRETWSVVSYAFDNDGMMVDYVPDRPAKSVHEKPFGNGYYTGHAIYAADGDFTWSDDDGFVDGRSCWKPSIHMPRWASRITLEITAVRVERLQDISEEDAKAEGVGSAVWFAAKGVPEAEWESLGEHGAHQASHINSFATLWESIYGEESWQANSWVWVIEFKRVEVSGE